MCIEGQGSETHAVLTAVGELHSLTDWQVSEASEEAELVDFWERGGRRNERMREEKRRRGQRERVKVWGKSADGFQGGRYFSARGLRRRPVRSFISTRRLHHSAYRRSRRVRSARRSQSDSSESCRRGENCKRKSFIFSNEKTKQNN